MLIVLTLNLKILNFSTYNLQCRLLGYLILFATDTFVTQCQFITKSCFHNRYSFIYLQISPFHIKFYFSLLNSSKIVFILIKVKLIILKYELILPSTDALHLIMMNNTRSSRITAAAGTSISRNYNFNLSLL